MSTYRSKKHKSGKVAHFKVRGRVKQVYSPEQTSITSFRDTPEQILTKFTTLPEQPVFIILPAYHLTRALGCM